MERTVVVARDQGQGEWELLFNGHRGSFWEGEKSVRWMALIVAQKRECT